MPDRRSQPQQTADHDLLIEIKTELGFVRTEVKDLKENVTGKITELETTRATITTTNDHEKRIRRIEFWGAVGYGILLTLQIYLQFFHH